MGTVYLLLDDDGDFTNGGTQKLQMTQNGANYEVHFPPSASVAYFTIATRVPDTTPPVVMLSGDATLTVVQSGAFVDPGARWTDDTDGAGVISQASSGSVDTSLTGSYLLEYRYTDSAGNQSNIVTRTVEVIIPISGSMNYESATFTTDPVTATITLNQSGTVMNS
jgi:hypothetical protein